MVRLLLIVQVANASDQRVVAIVLRPFDSFTLCFKSCQNVVGMIFNDIVIDMATLR
jgi:hypothetical protein